MGEKTLHVSGNFEAHLTIHDDGIPAEKTWPNEPEGMRVISDWGLDQPPVVNDDAPIPNGNGWRQVNNGPVGREPLGWTELFDDPSALVTPPKTWRWVYPKGMVEGTAPSTVYYWGEVVRETYFAFWWKVTDPFDLSNNGTKIAFLFTGDATGNHNGQMFLAMAGNRKLYILPEWQGDVRWRNPLPGVPEIKFDVWHLVEWYSNIQTGRMTLHLDDQLYIEANDVRNETLIMPQLSPTYGGNSGVKKKWTDYYTYDHVRFCVRGDVERPITAVRAVKVPKAKDSSTPWPLL